MARLFARSDRSVGGCRTKTASKRSRLSRRQGNLALGLLATVSTLLLMTSLPTQDAAAFGETRTLSFFHTHTRESLTVTFRRNGQVDEGALSQLNWFLRDWRVE